MYIYIVRVSIDWHNTDPTDTTIAFEDKNDAYGELVKQYNKFKGAMAKNGRDIAYDGGIVEDAWRVFTESDDYAYGWIEKIALHPKKK